MTACPDVYSDTNRPVDAPRMIDGSRMLVRGGRKLLGVALVLAALGLWLQPGALLDADILLFKLALSLAIGFVGLATFQSGQCPAPVDVEIDTVRREVRLVRGKGQGRSIVSRTKLTDLGPAEMRGNLVRLWTADGGLIAEVALSDPATRNSLLGALRDADKL